jgi:hypothetical protein
MTRRRIDVGVDQGAVEPDGTKMIYCLACGTANKDGSKFCDECGDQLAAQGAKRGDVPPWVTEMEETLRTQTETDEDGEPREILEVPDWFRDLQASQPDRYVKEAFQLGVGENESIPAWLASVQGMQTSVEPPQEVAEPPQAGADFMLVDDGSVQTEADSGQIGTEPRQAMAEPQQAVAQPPRAPALPPRPAGQPQWATALSPHASAQPPQEETEPLPAGTESAQHDPKDRTAEDPPDWPQELRATAPETKTAQSSREGHDAGVQGPGWLVEAQTAEGAGEPRALAREGDTAEESLDLPMDPCPAAQEPREDGALTGSEGSDRLLALKLRNLRGKEAKQLDGVIALEKGSGVGEWLPDLVDSLPVQASIVQGQGAVAVPERETANPDRFASRARVFSEIVAHPAQVTPVVTAQPESGSLSRPARYAISAVLIVIALGVVLALAFYTRFSLLVGWLQSILENLGGLIGG